MAVFKQLWSIREALVVRLIVFTAQIWDIQYQTYSCKLCPGMNPFLYLVLARQTTIFFRANHNPTVNLLWRSFSCIDLVITYTLKTPAEMLYFDAKAFHFEIPFIRQATVKHLCSILLFIVLVAGLLSHWTAVASLYNAFTTRELVHVLFLCSTCYDGLLGLSNCWVFEIRNERQLQNW